ncbi:MAG: ATP synthase F1 subunit epsilon [Candidatus Dojkabacteria bacterium]
MLHLIIRTIDSLVIDTEVEYVSFFSNEGYLTILEGHEDMMLQIRPGYIEIQSSAGKQRYIVLDGVARVAGGEKIIMLVNELETTDTLDETMIQEAIARAEHNLHKAELEEDVSDYEYEVLKAKLFKELAKERGE